jgi:hypothetical protein
MTPKGPVVDILIARDGEAWRIYQAPKSWRGGILRSRADERGDVFPVGRPDAADLDRFMWETDSPYDGRPTGDGGIEIVAKGRSAVCLLVWLEELVKRANPSRFVS